MTQGNQMQNSTMKMEQHPRLMLTNKRIGQLKDYQKTDKQFQKKVDVLRKQCDGLLKKPASRRRAAGRGSGRAPRQPAS